MLNLHQLKKGHSNNTEDYVTLRRGFKWLLQPNQTGMVRAGNRRCERGFGFDSTMRGQCMRNLDPNV